MNVRSSAWSALIYLGSVSLAGAQDSIPTVPIASRAVATLNIPGYVDFLATDGATVWVTNEERVEQLRIGDARPVASCLTTGFA